MSVDIFSLPVFGVYDVVVAGGGPAGLGAALSSARNGMKTLIVEQFNCLGGVATAGGHGNMPTNVEHETNRRIVEELLSAIETDGCGARMPEHYDLLGKMDIITHRLNFDEFEKGVEAMNSGNCGRVVLDWEF